ncbi:unnamed protein product [Notodromas monacha]|uniref:Uncharacterized protein n=1 Tax=Notodromas monacha TaxID=399045 RepID=A0A7R9GCM5_9CRUS|nr:unnamed protein product [Notodromas monacha]CAG0916007.1 unnamed protein product [Notodromas monacha]
MTEKASFSKRNSRAEKNVSVFAVPGAASLPSHDESSPKESVAIADGVHDQLEPMGYSIDPTDCLLSYYYSRQNLFSDPVLIVSPPRSGKSLMSILAGYDLKKKFRLYPGCAPGVLIIVPSSHDIAELTTVVKRFEAILELLVLNEPLKENKSLLMSCLKGRAVMLADPQFLIEYLEVVGPMLHSFENTIMCKIMAKMAVVGVEDRNMRFLASNWSEQVQALWQSFFSLKNARLLFVWDFVPAAMLFESRVQVTYGTTEHLKSCVREKRAKRSHVLFGSPIEFFGKLRRKELEARSIAFFSSEILVDWIKLEASEMMEKSEWSVRLAQAGCTQMRNPNEKIIWIWTDAQMSQGSVRDIEVDVVVSWNLGKRWRDFAENAGGQVLVFCDPEEPHPLALEKLENFLKLIRGERIYQPQTNLNQVICEKIRRANVEKSLCLEFRLFGKCEKKSLFCNRHFFKTDSNLVKDLPLNSWVTVCCWDVVEGGLYTGHLHKVQHNGKSMDYLISFENFSMALESAYKKKKSYVRVPKKNQVYVVELKWPEKLGFSFFRAKVEEILGKDKIKVYAVDRGFKTVLKIDEAVFHEVPAEFKEVPGKALNFVNADMMPLPGSPHWHPETRELVLKELNDKLKSCNKSCKGFFEGKVIKILENDVHLQFVSATSPDNVYGRNCRFICNPLVSAGLVVSRMPDGNEEETLYFRTFYHSDCCVHAKSYGISDSFGSDSAAHRLIKCMNEKTASLLKEAHDPISDDQKNKAEKSSKQKKKTIVVQELNEEFSKNVPVIVSSLDSSSEDEEDIEEDEKRVEIDNYERAADFFQGITKEGHSSEDEECKALVLADVARSKVQQAARKVLKSSVEPVILRPSGLSQNFWVAKNTLDSEFDGWKPLPFQSVQWVDHVDRVTIGVVLPVFSRDRTYQDDIYKIEFKFAHPIQTKDLVSTTVQSCEDQVRGLISVTLKKAKAKLWDHLICEDEKKRFKWLYRDLARSEMEEELEEEIFLKKLDRLSEPARDLLLNSEPGKYTFSEELDVDPDVDNGGDKIDWDSVFGKPNNSGLACLTSDDSEPEDFSSGRIMELYDCSDDRAYFTSS